MKARPRSVERKVAKYLTVEFEKAGMSPVERIPVLGRTGPDITSNEAHFIIDVKSRLEVPKLFLPPKGLVVFIFKGGLVVFRLQNIADLFNHEIGSYVWVDRWETSKVVLGWYDHMDEWTKANGGITALILHKPRMPIGASAFVMSYSDFKKFNGGSNE